MNLYWLTRLDGIQSFATELFITGSIFSVIGSIVFGIFFVGTSQEGYADERKLLLSFKKPLIILIVTTCLSGMGSLFIPTTKEAAFIIVGEKLLQNKTVQELPKDMFEIRDLAIDYLKDKLEVDKKD